MGNGWNGHLFPMVLSAGYSLIKPIVSQAQLGLINYSVPSEGKQEFMEKYPMENGLGIRHWRSSGLTMMNYSSS
jgi:hypothetical protein